MIQVEPTAKVAGLNARERALLDMPACLSPDDPNHTIDHIPYCGKLAAGLCGGSGGRPDRVIHASTAADSGRLFAVGERVDGLVAVRNKRPRWFSGRVKRLNSDGRLHICYDDGDEEPAKDKRDVRPSMPRRPRAKPPPRAVGLNGGERAGALPVRSIASNVLQCGEGDFCGVSSRAENKCIGRPWLCFSSRLVECGQVAGAFISPLVCTPASFFLSHGAVPRVSTAATTNTNKASDNCLIQ